MEEAEIRAHSGVELGSIMQMKSDQTTDNAPDPTPKSQQVYLPDLFSSIMAVEPAINPNYLFTKARAEAWIAKILQADEEWTAKNSRADFAWLCAIFAPNCDEEALKTTVDWHSWVFLFDDQFDEGHLKGNPSGAKKEVDIAIGIMEGTHPVFRSEEHPIRNTFQSVCDRVRKGSTKDFQQYWIRMHKKYFEGLLEQCKVVHEKRTFQRDAFEYINLRRQTAGGHPTLALIQYAEGVELPQNIFAHPSLQELMCVSLDLVGFVNDILSYKKDLALGGDQNLVLLLMAQGLSTQQAMDRIGSMIDECYKRWYVTLANMPVWGEQIDQQVLRFVDACRNMALGNLHWSFKTGRYLGTEGDKVHRTRLLSLPQ